MDDIRNVIIVGSGPAGYTAAIYTARGDLQPLLLAGSVTAGGALMNTTEVENFPGFPTGVQGPDLMEAMRSQAEKFGTQILVDDAVALRLTGPVKEVDVPTNDGVTTYRARAVIVATGSSYRELGVPNEKRLSGRGVSWCATCDGFFFRNKSIAVIGGGDSAMEEALFLTRFAESVTVVHRRDELRASAIMATRARKNPKITFAWNSAVVDVLGDTSVTGLLVRDVTTDSERTLDVNGVFVAIGHEPRTELVADQLQLEEHGYVAVQPGTTHTSVEGVFACGDVVDHRYRQAITAAGTGCAAALDAERFLERAA